MNLFLLWVLGDLMVHLDLIVQKVLEVHWVRWVRLVQVLLVFLVIQAHRAVQEDPFVHWAQVALMDREVHAHQVGRSLHSVLMVHSHHVYLALPEVLSHQKVPWVQRVLMVQLDLEVLLRHVVLMAPCFQVDLLGPVDRFLL